MAQSQNLTRTVLLAAAVLLPHSVHAQPDDTLRVLTPPPPSSPAAPAECVPACRSGYMCFAGQCVSECNPPCASGVQCRQGQCVASSPKALPEQHERPGAETHDGLMLRFTLGFGYSGAESDRGGPDEIGVSGVSNNFSFDIGGTLAENWVLHARFSELTIFSPSTAIVGDGFAVESSELNSSLFAPALTYNFMPANIYLTVAAGFSWLSGARSSDTGLGLNLDVGKEWWVSDNWGLGITGRFWFTNANDSAGFLGEVTYNMFGAAALFSATYN